MASIPQSGNQVKSDRVSLYGRTSTEDQHERQTVLGQLGFLRNYCQLYGLDVAGEYVDEGISGTIPFGDRPAGRRLLADARAGLFATVLVYRVDRLGRNLSSLLSAHDELAAVGVVLKSVTEPFDTSTPTGNFVFGLLGSVAQLEKDTITERMSLGRDRVARDGKWSNGPIPFGYDLDLEGKLVPSARIVPSIGITEAGVVRDLFARMASGSTTVAEARRFGTIGVPLMRRYSGGVETMVSRSGEWPTSRINFMIKNPTYRGVHVVKAKSGLIERQVEPLVDDDLWEAANRRLASNKTLSPYSYRQYLLRGLIRCEACGWGFTGSMSSDGKTKSRVPMYRCGSQMGASHADPAKRCHAKRVNAVKLEREVWNDCRRFIENPEAALSDAQEQLRARLAQSTESEAKRRDYLELLRDKEGERERTMTLFRRGRASLGDVEKQLDDIARETADLRTEIDRLDAQVELARVWESRVTDAAVMLGRLRENVAAIDGSNDFAAKRAIVEALVERVTVQTVTGEKKRETRVSIHYVFGSTQSAELANRNRRGRTLGTD